MHFIAYAWIGASFTIIVKEIVRARKNKKKKLKDDANKCQSCGEPNQNEAKICKFCGLSLNGR